MNIYLVDYWLPFPNSEYGGLECIVANDSEECYNLIVNSVSEYELETYEDYKSIIRDCVKRAVVLPLSGEHEPGNVKSFVT